MIANLERVLLESFTLNDPKDSASLCADDWIPAKGVYVNPRGKRLRDFGRSNDSSQRRAVGNALRHGDYIRDDVVRFKPPKMGSGPPEPRLNLVRDAKAARCPDVLVSCSKIAVRENDCSADSLN